MGIKMASRNLKSLHTLVFLVIFLVVVGIPLRASAACPPSGLMYGTDTMTASVPSATTYTFWLQMNPPSTTNNSVILQVDGTTCFAAGGSSSLPVNTWSWVDYQNGSSAQVMRLSLSAGNHSLELFGTQQNVEIGGLLLLADPNCVPVGSGSNCTTAQPAAVTQTSSTTTTGSGSTAANSNKNAAGGNPLSIQNVISSGIPLNANGPPVNITQPVVIMPTYVKGQTIKKVEYFLNSKKVYTATKPPFSYNLNPNRLLSGKYVLTSKTIYTSGLSITAHETIVIKHPPLKNASILLINYFWELLLAAVLIAAVVASLKNSTLLLVMIKKMVNKIRGIGGNGTGNDSGPQELPPTIIHPTNPVQ